MQSAKKYISKLKSQALPMWAFPHRHTTIWHKILSSALVTISTQYSSVFVWILHNRASRKCLPNRSYIITACLTVQGQQDTVQWCTIPLLQITKLKLPKHKGIATTICMVSMKNSWSTINWRQHKHDKHQLDATSRRLPEISPPPRTHISLKRFDFHNLEYL